MNCYYACKNPLWAIPHVRKHHWCGADSVYEREASVHNHYCHNMLVNN